MTLSRHSAFALRRSVTNAGSTSCLSDSLDWYTHAVGETPCATYQRLRQICDSSYEVGLFRSTAPGDNCNDQSSSCCCNSIAWNLSMLCMNCQQDLKSEGINAGPNAYQEYLYDRNGQICGSATNQSLPAVVQAVVCNNGLGLDNFLYHIFWTDGSWNYTSVKAYAESYQAAYGNNSFTNCPASATSAASTAISTTTIWISPTRSGLSSLDEASSISSVAGGVVGGLLGLAALALSIYALRRQRKLKKTPGDMSMDSPEPKEHPLGTVIPYSYQRVSASEARLSITIPGASEKTRHEPASPVYPSPPLSPSSMEAMAPLSTIADAHEMVESPEPMLPEERTYLLRHVDAGPAGQYIRSSTGKLPPAYHELLRKTDSEESRRSPLVV